MDQQQEITEVKNTELQDGATNVTRKTVTRKTGARSRIVLTRTVWFIVEVIVVLLLIRVALYLLGANEGSWFVDLLYGVSKPFAVPFYGIFKQPEYGNHVLDTASLVGGFMYTVFGWIITKLLTLTSAGNEV